MTIQENLNHTIQILKENKIKEPVLKARLLLCYMLEVEKEYLIIHSDEQMEHQSEEQYEKMVQKLIEGYPLQYITHHQEFMKLDFYVDENVLIPRADTEMLVEEVIAYAKKQKEEKIRILDLCTGSGAIAISLANYLPNCEIVAVDISKEALEVAKKNAQKNGAQNVIWVESNLLENVEGNFDVMVSNPPYIRSNVIPTLEKQVQKEPILALDGGKDGLSFYRNIIQKAPRYLKENGTLFFEIGYDQKEEVTNLLEQTKQYQKIKTKQDLAGNDRIVIASLKR